jgi:hypothetical protein
MWAPANQSASAFRLPSMAVWVLCSAGVASAPAPASAPLNQQRPLPHSRINQQRRRRYAAGQQQQQPALQPVPALHAWCVALRAAHASPPCSHAPASHACSPCSHMPARQRCCWPASCFLTRAAFTLWQGASASGRRRGRAARRPPRQSVLAARPVRMPARCAAKRPLCVWVCVMPVVCVLAVLGAYARCWVAGIGCV